MELLARSISKNGKPMKVVKRSSFQLIANSMEFIKTDGRGFEDGQDNDGTPF